jgi:hypothetical protein
MHSSLECGCWSIAVGFRLGWYTRWRRWETQEVLRLEIAKSDCGAYGRLL